MKFILCMTSSVLLLFAMPACVEEKVTQEITSINNICFKSYAGMQAHLPEEFLQTLLRGQKSNITPQAEEMDALFHRIGIVSPRYCVTNDTPLLGYSMSFRTKDKRYIGGRLDLYFLDEHLKAAELTMILLP